MSLTAKDIMKAPVTVLEPGMSLHEAAQVFAEDEISGAPVVGAGRKLVGILSRTDIVNRCLEGRLGPGRHTDLLATLGLTEGMVTESDDDDLGTVDTAMNDDVVTVGPDAPVAEVASQMADSRIHRVVVADGEAVLGIITSLDIIAHWGG